MNEAPHEDAARRPKEDGHEGLFPVYWKLSGMPYGVAAGFSPEGRAPRKRDSVSRPEAPKHRGLWGSPSTGRCVTPSNVLWKGHRLRIVRVQRCPAAVLREDTIYLSKGPGFGSGRHPTTRSCLQLLEALTETWNPPAVLDAGCGCGILSLAAARCGAQRVLGLDSDPEAVRTAVRNVTWNRLDTHVRVLFQDVRALRGWYDLILANLDPDTGSALGCALAEHVSPEGYLVLSGLSGFERDRALKRLRGEGGMDPVNECRTMGWCTLVFHRS